jgi:hypothetical protein
VALLIRTSRLLVARAGAIAARLVKLLEQVQELFGRRLHRQQPAPKGLAYLGTNGPVIEAVRVIVTPFIRHVSNTHDGRWPRAILPFSRLRLLGQSAEQRPHKGNPPLGGHSCAQPFQDRVRPVRGDSEPSAWACSAVVAACYSTRVSKPLLNCPSCHWRCSATRRGAVLVGPAP